MKGSEKKERLRVDVLGVRVSAVDMQDVRSEVRRWVDEGERKYVCVTGVHGVMESQGDEALREIHNRSGLTVPDGMPMVWAGKFAGCEAIDRVYGPTMMDEVCAIAAEAGWPIFLYGGGEGTAELLGARLEEKHPGLRVAGTFTPPFRELTEAERGMVSERIAGSGARLVWVGLSTPKQERWMAEFVNRLPTPCVLFGVGAAFDIHAGLKGDAPAWVGRIGLHWLYRLLQEPTRLWRRYLRNNPAFVWAILRRRPHLVEAGGDR